MNKRLVKKIREYANRLPEMQENAVRYYPIPEQNPITAGSVVMKSQPVKVRVNHLRRMKKRVRKYGFPKGIHVYMFELMLKTKNKKV